MTHFTITKVSRATRSSGQWATLAAALPNDDYKPTLPISVLLGEAIDVARFVDANFASEIDAKTKKVVRAGLETALGLTKTTASDLRSLVEATKTAHIVYLTTTRNRDDLVERARYVRDELRSTAQYFGDHGVIPVAQVQALHSELDLASESIDALALSLDGYAILTAPFKKKMEGVGGFDTSLIDEGASLARKLREKPTAPAVQSAASQKAVLFRNRLLRLLDEKVAAVRGAARYVFRHQPGITQSTSSPYLRARRAKARRVASEKKAPGPAGIGTNGVEPQGVQPTA